MNYVAAIAMIASVAISGGALGIALGVWIDWRRAKRQPKAQAPEKMKGGPGIVVCPVCQQSQVGQEIIAALSPPNRWQSIHCSSCGYLYNPPIQEAPCHRSLH